MPLTSIRQTFIACWLISHLMQTTVCQLYVVAQLIVNEIDAGENWAYGVHGIPPIYRPLSQSDNKEEVKRVCSGRENATPPPPPPPPPPVELDMTHSPALPSPHTPTAAASLLASLFAPQLAVLFYCECPGDVSVEQGMTGFYRHSHTLLCSALHQVMATLNPVPLPTTSASDPTLFRLSRLSDTRNLTFQALTKVLKEWGNLPDSRNLLIQPTLKDGQAILCLGPLVHTSMRAQLPMQAVGSAGSLLDDVSPRVLQNLKVYFTPSSSQKKKRSCVPHASYLSLYHPESLAWRFLQDPLTLHRDLFCRPSDEDKTGMLSYDDLKEQANALCTLLLEHDS